MTARIGTFGIVATKQLVRRNHATIINFEDFTQPTTKMVPSIDRTIAIQMIYVPLFLILGRQRMFKAIDSGNTSILATSVALDTLHLKPEAPVILIVNLSANLVNGLRGIVTSLSEEEVKVKFPSIGRTVDIGRYNFQKFDTKTGSVSACRRQIPLLLGFAMTVHRAQGLTLNSVQVDCRKMTQPGHIGVAIGRARTTTGLRVLNYSRKLLSQHPQTVTQYLEYPTAPTMDNISCCRMIREGAADVQMLDENQIHSDIRMEEDDLPLNCQDPADVEMWDEYKIPPTPEERADVQMLGVDDVPPGSPSVHLVGNRDLPAEVICELSRSLSKRSFEKPLTHQQKALNTALLFLQTNDGKTQDFATFVWNHLYIIYSSLQSGPVGNKNLTKMAKQIEEFVVIDQYRDNVAHTFEVKHPSKHQMKAGLCLVDTLRAHHSSKMVEPMQEKLIEKAATENLKDGKKMSPAGFGKLRYLGGWCVVTLRYRKKQAVRRNRYSQKACARVQQLDREVRLLDQIVATESELMETSVDKASLDETKRKQNIRGGLTNISDPAFHFFKELDHRIAQLENQFNMQLHGADLYVFIQKTLTTNPELLSQWINLFQPLVTDDEESMHHIASVQLLLQQIVEKYSRMTSAQLRREYLRQKKTKKQEAHRKQIRMRSTSTTSTTGKTEMTKKSKQKIPQQKKSKKAKLQPLRLNFDEGFFIFKF